LSNPCRWCRSRPDHAAKTADSSSIFNGAAVFDVSQQLSKDYQQGLLVALHKNGKADAYMVFLFNSYPDVKQRINTTLPSLQFKN
jgi:hypothetical protein